MFRKAIEGQFYWIDIESKSIAKVYPYLKEVRQKI